jgi:hypothetical protein
LSLNGYFRESPTVFGGEQLAQPTDTEQPALVDQLALLADCQLGVEKSFPPPPFWVLSKTRV